MTASESATAEERMSAGEEELRTALAADVLDRVKEGTWERFEQQVLDVLKAWAMAALAAQWNGSAATAAIRVSMG